MLSRRDAPSHPYPGPRNLHVQRGFADATKATDSTRGASRVISRAWPVTLRSEAERRPSESPGGPSRATAGPRGWRKECLPWPPGANPGPSALQPIQPATECAGLGTGPRPAQPCPDFQPSGLRGGKCLVKKEETPGPKGSRFAPSPRGAASWPRSGAQGWERRDGVRVHALVVTGFTLRLTPAAVRV